MIKMGLQVEFQSVGSVAMGMEEREAAAGEGIVQQLNTQHSTKRVRDTEGALPKAWPRGLRQFHQSTYKPSHNQSRRPSQR
jgi:hypothetical protein